jgi:hypothetical protein
MQSTRAFCARNAIDKTCFLRFARFDGMVRGCPPPLKPNPVGFRWFRGYERSISNTNKWESSRFFPNHCLICQY